ncbi:MAG: hypothetical protein QF824_05415 [Candidatus Woesearchaeota archaeon]|jgi:undecaprenyl phosphate-alpha-L-ara4N flippase subunit ArnE|nr:hypothetical protein [Candidatus Woesearchaeota archaeon]|tara:strand:- start:113 stop:487 length:375 start_codon:yes stop_codon:yes gene_type:complete
MTTKSWAIGLIILCTLLTSSAQIIYKFGIEPLNIYLIALGLAIYSVAAIILIKALKGGELSVLYPLIATSYIWVSIFSPIFFSTDSMNSTKWIGVVVIIIGISFIGLGSKSNSTTNETEVPNAN